MDLTTSTRTSGLDVPDDVAWERLVAGGSSPHWYVDPLPLRFRAGLDRLVGGARLVDPPDRSLQQGDDAGFWRVESAGDSELVLRARVRAPGSVVLTSTVRDGRLTQSVTFTPSGLLGTAYLLADLPAREALLTWVHARTVSEISAH